jgi:hypothetical protein
MYIGNGTEIYLLKGFPFVASCFFPIRGFVYAEEQQLKDNILYATETEKDRAMLDNFVLSVNSEGGSLDTTKLSFRWLDTHPDRATNVRSIVSFLRPITQTIFQY